MIRGMIMHDHDNVGVVLENALPGDMVSFGSQEVRARENIPAAHKIALVDIEMGDIVYKYGEPIGYAIDHISAGEHVHNHNIDSEAIMR
jgi:altronate dehydratase